MMKPIETNEFIEDMERTVLSTHGFVSDFVIFRRKDYEEAETVYEFKEYDGIHAWSTDKAVDSTRKAKLTNIEEIKRNSVVWAESVKINKVRILRSVKLSDEEITVFWDDGEAFVYPLGINHIPAINERIQLKRNSKREVVNIRFLNKRNNLPRPPVISEE